MPFMFYNDNLYPLGGPRRRPAFASTGADQGGDARLGTEARPAGGPRPPRAAPETGTATTRPGSVPTRDRREPMGRMRPRPSRPTPAGLRWTATGFRGSMGAARTPAPGPGRGS